MTVWCEWRDSNSHAEALASKTSVSTDSTTLAPSPAFYQSLFLVRLLTPCYAHRHETLT